MKLLLKAMLLGGLCWLGYTNMHLLGKATVACRNARDNTGTKLQMSQVARYVQMEYLDKNALPLGDITGLVVEQLAAAGQKVREESGKDTWGNPYWSIQTKSGFCVVSAGPDGKWRTKDDLYFQQSLTALGYRDAPAGATAQAGARAAPRTAPPRAGPKITRAKPVREAPPRRHD